MTDTIVTITEFGEDTAIINIVRWLILKELARSDNASGAVGSMKIHILLYYAQGWHLTFYKEPLFNSRIEAWVKVPMVVSYWNFEHSDQHEEFLSETCGINIDDLDITSDVSEYLGKIYETYGDFSGEELSDLTQTEASWVEARGDCGPLEDSDAEITQKSMQRYFSGRIAEASKE